MALLVGLALGPAAWSEQVADGSPLERLSRAVAQYPEDPDLAWAYARELSIDGSAEAAVRQTRRFVSAWPDRRPEARIDIARGLIDRGETSAALALLEEESSAHPTSGNAHFYRAIALRSEGRLLEADDAFQTAAGHAPTLLPETLLARALGLFDLGREEEAVGLLREILELDPTGDSALRARLLLRKREILDFQGRWHVDAYAGFDWDDNVTLESGTDEVLPSDREDFRGVWGASGTWRTLLTERTSVALGARYDQTRHVDLREYDVLGTMLFASGTWRATERSAIRIDAIAYDTLQDLEQEVAGGLLRPNWIYSFGPEWGAIRAFAQGEIAEYDDDAPFEPWERDAYSFGLGLEQFVPLAAKDSWIALSVAWQRTLTQAGTGGGSAGFDGDFDYDSWRVRGTGTLALPLEVRGEIDLAYNHDRYHNDNLTHLISTLGGSRQRQDDIVTGRVALSRPIIDHIELEVYWLGSRRISNVDLFDYDKQQAGMMLRVSTD